MSDELDDLYQEVILDHNRRPRNYGRMEGADRVVAGHNPLCGDRVTVYVDLDGDTVRDVSFEGTGCAIFKASASIMTELMKGRTKGEARALFETFRELVTRGPAAMSGEELGKMAVFSGICEFPARVKCATLAWHTVHAAIEGSGEQVSTE